MEILRAIYHWLTGSNDSHMHRISDNFSSLKDVSSAVRKSGLEGCNLIIGIDFTASNRTQGEQTFGGKCLHSLDATTLNPYQQVINIIGETMQEFDEDNLIPAYGFGDLTTKDITVFPLCPNEVCEGFKGVLDWYSYAAHAVTLSGPTSFAPLIYKAIEIVKNTRCFHILVIIADGQVTSERPTVEAIEAASLYPLSIIMVGVGDGPWDTMKDYDDKLPNRKFDNFQFVDFHKVMTHQSSAKNPQVSFALQALMELPEQYQTIRKLGMLG